MKMTTPMMKMTPMVKTLPDGLGDTSYDPTHEVLSERNQIFGIRSSDSHQSKRGMGFGFYYTCIGEG